MEDQKTFVKSKEINHVFYDKEKYVSKNMMEEFPYDYRNINYDVNDKIVLTNISYGKFNNEGNYVFKNNSIIDILYRIK